MSDERRATEFLVGILTLGLLLALAHVAGSLIFWVTEQPAAPLWATLFIGSIGIFGIALVSITAIGLVLMLGQAVLSARKVAKR